MNPKVAARVLVQRQVMDTTLEEILAVHSSAAEDCQRIQDHVSTYLYSDYPERRGYAKRALQNEFQTKVDVGIIRDEGIYSYIRIGSNETWILIDYYAPNWTFSEEKPTAEDHEKWRRVSTT
jgi:hypothetical protein